MTTSHYPDITDELLSAYIDGAVTGLERIAVEQAATADPEVAWRLRTLQETVHLLRTLPSIPAPRSFVMTAEQLGGSRAETLLSGAVYLEQAPIAALPALPAMRSPGLWERIVAGWHTFWLCGSPPLRNAMAASMAALLLLLLTPSLLSTQASRIANQTQLAPTDVAPTLLSNSLAAPESPRRSGVLSQRTVSVPEVDGGTSAPESSLSKALPVDASATFADTTQNRTVAPPAGAVPETVTAVPALAGSALAAGAGPFEDQLRAAPDADPGDRAADALSFAPSVVPALSGEDATLLDAAPVAANQGVGKERAGGSAAVPLATTEPSEDAVYSGRAEGSGSLPAAPPAVAQEGTWLWFQLLAAFAVVIFGFLWWRSR